MPSREQKKNGVYTNNLRTSKESSTSLQIHHETGVFLCFMGKFPVHRFPKVTGLFEASEGIGEGL